MNMHELLPAIIIVVVIILAASFSSTILTSVQSGQFVSTGVTNETINFATNGTYYSFAHNPVTSVTKISNDTYNMALGNFTYTTTQIKLISADTDTWIEGEYQVTYVYTATTQASNVTGYGLTTLVNITQQMPNTGLILVVSVIIGILIGSFIVYQKNRQSF